MKVNVHATMSVNDAVETVASVTETRDDVGLLVEVVVNSCDNNLDVCAVAHCLFKFGDTFRSCENAYAGDILGATFEQVVRCCDHGVTGGEHRVEDEALATGQVVGQAVGVGFNFEGVLVATHAEEADFCGRDQAGHAFEHAQACAQDGDDDRARFGDLQANGWGDGRVDRGFGNGDVARGLVGEQCDELVDELAEGCGRRFAVAQNGELMANKRVVRDMKMHSSRLPRAGGQWVARRRFRDYSASVPLVFVWGTRLGSVM